MAKPIATVSVRKVNDQIGVLDIQGEVTAAAETALMDAYAQTGTQVRSIILNFTNLVYMNSSGIGLLGPLQGFGQLWQKTYSVRLEGSKATPEEVMTTWKQNFPKFWPRGNRFYPSLVGIAPGEVALLSLAMPGGMPLSTGMLVLYSDNV